MRLVPCPGRPGSLVGCPTYDIHRAGVAEHSLSPEDEKLLQDLTERLSLEELLGQTLMVGFHAMDEQPLDSKSNDGLENLVTEFKIGNVILYKHNMPDRGDPAENRQRIWELSSRLQSSAYDSQPNGHKIPLLIATDHEGGGGSKLETR